jgi:DNA-binding winged helix-turn-helix (wHTH) protein
MAADAGATGTAAAVRRVVLAHEPAVRLGPLTIAPALRQIIHADGRDEIVEPKVMEVLVVLLRARGRILTRDELCAAAWDGRIVGDDAINRALSRLRRLGEGIGAGVFAITKAGYRRVATVPAEPAADDRPAGSTIAEPSLPPVPPEHEIAPCLLRDNLGESLRQSGLELVIATRRRCST